MYSGSAPERCARKPSGAATSHGARVVRDQALLPGASSRASDHGFAGCPDARKSRFDFTELDAEAANLHLEIVAAQVFEIAVG